MMSCVWFSRDVYRDFTVAVLLGAPGTGKTTTALHIVAYDLYRRRKAATYEEALEKAAEALYLGADAVELVEFLLSNVDSAARDWLIVDDAAVGFFDIDSTRAWSAVMDALKVARNSIVRRGIIFTTTNRSYVARRVLGNATLTAVVSRRKLPYSTAEDGGRCRVYDDEQMHEYVAVKEIAWLVRSHDTFAYSKAEMRLYARLAGLIPVDKRFAMPRRVEEEHIEARKRRVKAQLEKALALLVSRRNADQNE
jgi:hypothetical protein